MKLSMLLLTLVSAAFAKDTKEPTAMSRVVDTENNGKTRSPFIQHGC